MHAWQRVLGAGVLLAAVAVAGCKSSTDSGSLQPVSDFSSAKLVAGGVLDAVKGGVVPQLTAGTSSAKFTKTVSGSQGGTATVTGYYYPTACGSGVGQYWTINIDITFSNFATMGLSTNVLKKLNGSTNYHAVYGACSTFITNSSAIQSALFWGTSDSLAIQAIIDGSSGVSDTVNFFGSGDPVSSGWVKGRSGTTVSF